MMRYARTKAPLFNREGSTLGIMDDIQIALHSYDGCGRGCSGCLVDKHFKNAARFKPIFSRQQLDIIDQRVREYAQWATETLNNKETGYFGKNGYQIKHHSYTFRFGHHGEMAQDDLLELAGSLQTDYRVFSSGPPTPEELDKFARVKQVLGGLVMLEIIYDPFVDFTPLVRQAILGMRERGLNGYPELLLTKRLLSEFSAKRFVEECLVPLGDLGTQLQIGRYNPSRTRNFNRSQVTDLDEEVEWIAEVAREIVGRGLQIDPIPLGEYAVTLLDEYGEDIARRPDGSIDENILPDEDSFDYEIVREKTKDIFLTSLYIDHNLDVFVWSESVGQHVLDDNYGYTPLGNLMKTSLIDIATEKGGMLDRMLNETMRGLVTNHRCAPCRYKSFCASHAISLFRNAHPDNGKYCYGHIPVIREFQKDTEFLDRMIGRFRELNF